MPQAALATIGAVTAVAGTGLQLKAASEQRSAQRYERKQQELVTRQERRQAIRQAQRIRAQTVATATGTGATGSSSLSGGLSSLGSQIGSGLGFSTQGSGLTRRIESASSRASSLGSIGGLAMGVGSFMFKEGGGFGGLRAELQPLEQPAPTRPPSFTPTHSGFTPRPFYPQNQAI